MQYIVCAIWLHVFLQEAQYIINFVEVNMRTVLAQNLQLKLVIREFKNNLIKFILYGI